MKPKQADFYVNRADVEAHQADMLRALADPEAALYRLKRRLAQRRRDLLDPHWADPRRFPSVNEGMHSASTRDYVRLYAALNAERRLVALGFINIDGDTLS